MGQSKCGSTNVEMARKCLGLIRDIADRGASSWDANTVGFSAKRATEPASSVWTAFPMA
jgi:hypothetical protein